MTTGTSALPANLIPPAYDEATLADILPGMLTAVGVAGETDRLTFDPVRSAVLLLVDGLGANLLSQHAAHAPYLAAAMDAAGRRITAGFPTTTITSLGSLGVGAPAGVHGMTGYQVLVPGTRRILNALQWDPTIDPRVWQPHPTALERARDDGVAVTCIAPPEFAGSGLTIATLRGGDYVGAVDAATRIEGARRAQRRAERNLTYIYWGDVDRCGHTYGCQSAEWLGELERLDAFVEQLAATVPSDGLLAITADHGMVDVVRDVVVDVADDRSLRIGIEVFAGEGRCRYLHVRPGAQSDVLAIWRDTVDPDEYLVLSREQVIDGGLLGPTVSADAAARTGDVVVLSRGLGAVFVSGTDSPQVMGLIGQHGSLTADEVYVPLIEVAGAR